MTERPFRGRTRGVEVHLDAGERELLRHLLAQLDDLLDDGRPASTDPLAALVGFDLSAADLEDQPGADGDAVPITGPAGAGRGLDRSRTRIPRWPDCCPRATGMTRRRRPSSAATPKAACGPGSGRTRGRRRPRWPGPDRVMLGAEEAMALLTSLTDVRLVLAERLGLRTDEDAAELHRLLTLRVASAEAGDGHDRGAAIAAIYDILTWWQESLVAALFSRPYRRGHR